MLVEVCHQRQIHQVIYTSVTIARERVSTGNLPVTRHLVEICWVRCFLPGRPWEFSDGPLTQLCKCNGLPDNKIWTKMVEHNIPDFVEQTSKDSSIRAVHKLSHDSVLAHGNMFKLIIDLVGSVDPGVRRVSRSWNSTVCMVGPISLSLSDFSCDFLLSKSQLKTSQKFLEILEVTYFNVHHVYINIIHWCAMMCHGAPFVYVLRPHDLAGGHFSTFCTYATARRWAEMQPLGGRQHLSMFAKLRIKS